jgi:hypothetical protein
VGRVDDVLKPSLFPCGWLSPVCQLVDRRHPTHHP